MLITYNAELIMTTSGLKSVHSVYGEPHDEEGIVYVNDEHTKQSQFIKGKILSAEKEM